MNYDKVKNAILAWVTNDSAKREMDIADLIEGDVDLSVEKLLLKFQDDLINLETSRGAAEKKLQYTRAFAGDIGETREFLSAANDNFYVEHIPSGWIVWSTAGHCAFVPWGNERFSTMLDREQFALDQRNLIDKEIERINTMIFINVEKEIKALAGSVGGKQ